MADTIEELKQELAYYKVKGAIGYYYELNRWVNGTVELMKTRGVKNLLSTGKDDDPKKFEKMMTIIKNTKEWIDNMEDIRVKFGLIGDEQKDREKKPFLDRIADKRE